MKISKGTAFFGGATEFLRRFQKAISKTVKTKNLKKLTQRFQTYLIKKNFQMAVY